MWQRWVWGSAFGLGVQLCALGAQAQCTKDVECKGDRICAAGECVEPSPAPPAAAAPAPAPAASPPATALAPVVVSDATAPPAPPEEPTVYRRKSTPLMVTGAVVGAVGVVGLISGIALGVKAKNCREDVEAKYGGRSLPLGAVEGLDECTSDANTSTWLVLGGVVLAVAGVPMFVVGGKQVPVHTSAARLSPWLTPRAGGLSLRFDL